MKFKRLPALGPIPTPLLPTQGFCRCKIHSSVELSLQIYKIHASRIKLFVIFARLNVTKRAAKVLHFAAVISFFHALGIQNLPSAFALEIGPRRSKASVSKAATSSGVNRFP